jgi:hypothetical protein
LALVTTSECNINILEGKINEKLLTFPAVCPSCLAVKNGKNMFSISGKELTCSKYLKEWKEYEEKKKRKKGIREIDDIDSVLPSDVTRQLDSFSQLNEDECRENELEIYSTRLEELLEERLEQDIVIQELNEIEDDSSNEFSEEICNSVETENVCSILPSFPPPHQQLIKKLKSFNYGVYIVKGDGVCFNSNEKLFLLYNFF